MGLPNSSDQTHTDFLTMRILGPFWNDGNLKMPDGKQAVMNYARNNRKYKQDADYLRVLGRGIATVRLTHFAQRGLWVVNGVEDNDDLRHNSTIGNWVHMTDIKCNNPDSKYFGQNIMLHDPESGALLCNDTIRDWFDFPLYKIYLKDMNAEANEGATQFNGATKGSNANWYLYRLAEAYLVRAEARLYQNDVSGATEDVNALRERARCSQFYSAVNIGDIANERARELYLEEWRNVELTRISYGLAKSGIPDEWGNTYSLGRRRQDRRKLLVSAHHALLLLQPRLHHKIRQRRSPELHDQQEKPVLAYPERGHHRQQGRPPVAELRL